MCRPTLLSSRPRPARAEIRVVDLLGAVAVDEIEVGAADPLDRRDVELARAAHGLGLDRAALDRQRQRLLGVLDPERHAFADGPCAWRKSAAWPDGSMLRMKLMSPCA